MRTVLLAVLFSSVLGTGATAQYLGNYTANPYLPPAPPQPPGTYSNLYGNSSNSPSCLTVRAATTAT